MSAHSFEVNEADFELQVLQASHRVPVLVDFWAPWCAPCRALKPVLEKLVLENDGGFLLAKLNTDDNPGLAAQYGIRGIPNVKGFRDGAVAAEFSGAIPESGVREFLEKLMPTESRKLYAQAQAALQAGDREAGEKYLRASLQLDPASEESRLDLAEILIARKGWTEADALMSEMPSREPTPRAEKTANRIAFWKKGQALPSAAEFLQSIQRAPQNLQARLLYAEKLIADGFFEEAMEQLLEVVQRSRAGERESARKLMLQIFQFASDQPDLVGRYRRMLAAALH